jgi:broad specificity phosphatase PhoE
MSTEITLIRHGRTDWNEIHRMQGHDGPGLNAAGRAQIAGVAGRLSGQTWDALYSSDLDRALESARIIGAACGLGVQPDPRLREWRMGIWTGWLSADIHRLTGNERRLHWLDPLSYIVPGAETGREVLRRATAACDAIAHRHAGGRVLAVTHGGVISLLRWLVLGDLDPRFLQTDTWKNWPVNGETFSVSWPHQRPAGFLPGQPSRF